MYVRRQCYIFASFKCFFTCQFYLDVRSLVFLLFQEVAVFCAWRPRRLAAVWSLREHQAYLQSYWDEQDSTLMRTKQPLYHIAVLMCVSLNVHTEVWHPETVNKELYHRLFDVLLIIATWCVVIAVNNLNSNVALWKTSASFTCMDWKWLLCNTTRRATEIIFKRMNWDKNAQFWNNLNVC